MNKQQQIDAFLSQPVKIGDYIHFQGNGNGSQREGHWGHAGRSGYLAKVDCNCVPNKD